MTVDQGILAICVAILLFVIAEFFSMREWKGEIKEWKKGVDTWKENLDGWRRSVDAILSEIRGINTIQPGSPLTLSPLGETVSKEIGGPDWASNKAAEVIADVPGDTAYEIQEFAFHYVHDRFDP